MTEETEANKALIRAHYQAATNDFDLGVLVITHYHRLLDELRPDVVHILVKGRIVDTGGPELAGQLEETGYAAWLTDDDEPVAKVDPFADNDPFADPFA